MKIFAKRTKKVASPGEKKTAASGNTSTPADKNFASDRIVEEELLKKNPSELNAKERRLVRRYRDRKAQDGKDIGEQEDSKKEEPEDDDGNKEEYEKDQNEPPEPESESGREDDSDEEDKDDSENEDEDEPAAEPEEKEPDAKKRKMNDSTSSNTGNDLESVLEAQVFEQLNSKQRRKLSRMISRTGEEDAPSLDEIKAEARAMLEETGAGGSGKAEASAKKVASEGQSLDMVELQKLLEGLNSKQRRTLTRRLEREGESCLAEVREEADKYLKSTSAETASGKEAEETNNSTSSTASSSGKKRKRKRGSADLSALTPEERLRREEQRRLQKEAEERRANESDSSYPFRHPLNSERRRANRRKPKWAPKKAFANERKVEHNSSGYQARKLKST